MTDIAIVNACSVLTDAEIAAVVPALQAQITEDFTPIWISTATLHFFDKRHKPPRGMWLLEILDHSDVPGALGYHVDQRGRVSGKVFAADDMKFGVSWTIDLSHELLEMLGDPSTEIMAVMPDGRRCMREVCDAVEDDAVAYRKNGVLVSNFCTPAYFYAGPGGRYDFCYKLHASAPALTPGGYLGIYDPTTGLWTRTTARLVNGDESHRSRRHGRTGWRTQNRGRPSTPETACRSGFDATRPLRNREAALDHDPLTRNRTPIRAEQ